MKRNFDYLSERQNLIRLTLHGSDLPADAPCVVYLHGFKGFKDWGFAPWAGEKLAKEGIRMLSMNFSHNGIGGSPLEFTEEDKFRDNTLLLEIEEAREIIGEYHRGKLFGAVPGSNIGVLGHSRGGGIALLSTWDMPEVKAVCTWAAVSTFFRYPPDVIEAWRQNGVHKVTNSRTGQVLELGWNLHQELIDHGEGRLNIEKAVRATEKPLCVIHGTDDAAVSVDDADAIFAWADNTGVEIHLVPDTGHTFGAKHPFAGTNPHLDDVYRHTQNFFSHHLKP